MSFTPEQYISKWIKRYNLTVISSSLELNTGLQIEFRLRNEHIQALKNYKQPDYERFKIRAEMYAKGLMRLAFPKLNSYLIHDGVLALSGSPVVIDAFLELLFNPAASRDL